MTFVPEIPTFDDTDVGATDILLYTGENSSENEHFMAYFKRAIHETSYWRNQALLGETNYRWIITIFMFAMLERHHCT